MLISAPRPPFCCYKKTVEVPTHRNLAASGPAFRRGNDVSPVASPVALRPTRKRGTTVKDDTGDTDVEPSVLDWEACPKKAYKDINVNSCFYQLLAPSSKARSP